MKTLIMVRNPLEVAHSMKERNGTSYSFGLRLWEIYNQRVIETAYEQDRLVTHYGLFFEDPETELRRITNFIGLPDTRAGNAAALVTKRRRHTHFTIDQLIDAGVAPEAIELYRGLVAEASQRGKSRRVRTTATQAAKSNEADLLPGSVSRLNACVPERMAQIENLYHELLAQAEKRHKAQVEELMGQLAKTEARHKAQVEELTAHVERMNQLLRDKALAWPKAKHRRRRRKRLCQQLKVPRSFIGCWTTLVTQQLGFALPRVGNLQILLPL
jgi:hypothetical protein